MPDLFPITEKEVVEVEEEEKEELQEHERTQGKEEEQEQEKEEKVEQQERDQDQEKEQNHVSEQMETPRSIQGVPKGLIRRETPFTIEELINTASSTFLRLGTPGLIAAAIRGSFSSFMSWKTLSHKQELHRPQ